MTFRTKFSLVTLLSSFHHTVGEVQYTPDAADWSTLQSKVINNHFDHSPGSVSWIGQDEWIEWDGTIFDPTQYGKAEFKELICPGQTVRGVYELFESTNPFEDNKNPTKAEVDKWHSVVLNHIRNLVGYTEDEYKAKPDECLHLRALWSQERHRTDKWDDKYPDNTCVDSTNPHCGATFVPSDMDQREPGYLPDGMNPCSFELAGSEGITSAGKASIPWSIRWIRPFCEFLGNEGFWGGHVQPFFLREKFGWSWRDIDTSEQNSNTQTRLKWGGSKGTPKYENPNIENFLIDVDSPYSVDPNATFPDYVCIIPEGLSFSDSEKYFDEKVDNATECYRKVMANETCGKRFMTFSSRIDDDEKFGCACYPPEMENCNPERRPFQHTWDFRPISYNFDGIFIDISKDLDSFYPLPWKDAECENVVYVEPAASLSQCLEVLVKADFRFCVDGFQFECGRDLMTWNANGEESGSCGCYPLGEEICGRKEGGRKANGRLTYELETDPSYNMAMANAPTVMLPCSTRSPTVSQLPTVMPSEAPSDSIQYFEGYYIDTTIAPRNDPLPWNDRICPNIGHYTTASSPRNCLQLLVENDFVFTKNDGSIFRCARNLLTWLRKDTGNCAFYPEEQEICKRNGEGESIRSIGRETYEIQLDSSFSSPTTSPIPLPTKLPTSSPTPSPTKLPTKLPTTSPTSFPTKLPTKLPTSSPTKLPTKLPTSSPTKLPTKLPTTPPTSSPTKLPTKLPTEPPGLCDKEVSKIVRNKIYEDDSTTCEARANLKREDDNESCDDWCGRLGVGVLCEGAWEKIKRNGNYGTEVPCNYTDEAKCVCRCKMNNGGTVD